MESIVGRLRREAGRLEAGVQAHIEQVRACSVELARRHGLDVGLAEAAALGHDVCRGLSNEELLRQARAFGLHVGLLEEALPVFLHGPIGAEVLRREYGLHDEGALNAVRCHTMGRAGMTPLDKVLFLADKVDPGKTGKYPFIGEVQRLALEDLDRGLLHFLDHQVRAFIQQGELVHPAMMAARNEAVLAMRRRQVRAKPSPPGR